MICNTFTKEDFKEIEQSRKIGKVQYYYVRFNAKEVESDLIQAVEAEIDHYPTAEDVELLSSKYLETLKKGKIVQIKEYDKSNAINKFIINSKEVWMDKDTRVGIKNGIVAQKEEGATTVSVMFGDTWYELPVEDALGILNAVEVYAMACFKRTSEHITAVESLTTIDAVSSYDFTTSYPKVQEFVIE